MPEPTPLPDVIPVTPRPPVDIALLNQFLTSVGSFNEEWIFGVGPAKSLYHYTDLAGLLGILSTSDLWLTHSRYSNDEQEQTHGYALARRLIDEARKTPEMPVPEWLAYLDQLSALLAQPSPQPVYICCFCRSDNLLSQWRGYAGNGSGVSIRMQSSQFDVVTGPDSPHGGLMRLWKTFYEQELQQTILSMAIRQPFKSGGPVQIRAAAAADAIEFFIPTFKNADFREENEVRLIFSPPPNCPVQPAFRVRGAMLVPYYSLKELSKVQRLPLTGITVGPSTNKKMNVESVRMMLAKFGYSDVPVDASPTSYRA